MVEISKTDASFSLKEENVLLENIYEDRDLLVVNKPAGMIVHPTSKIFSGTLVNALLFKYPLLYGEKIERPGVVHRLDKNTSGLILIALNEFCYQALKLAFKNREIKKVYRALCVGSFKTKEFTLNTNHKRDPNNRAKFTTKIPSAKIAFSKFRVLKTVGNISEILITIITGRSHQIRVQLSDINHPIIGDVLYGGPKFENFNRIALHAESLFFNHPITRKPLFLKAPINFNLF